jgi:hypothetical protein
MIQEELRRDGEVEFEGVKLRMVGEARGMKPGDTYVAERNQGPRLLTVLEMDLENGWVLNTEGAYPYDLHECVQVEIVDE